MKKRLSLLLLCFVTLLVIAGQFLQVGDARSAAREAACADNLRVVRDWMIRYSETALRTGDKASGVIDLRSITEALKRDASKGGGLNLRCMLAPNEAGHEGLVWPPDTTMIDLRRLLDDSRPPTEVIVCHDSDHLHRINTMVHTIVLLSNGGVRRISVVDEKRYREWIEAKFRIGRTSYADFLSDAGVQAMK